jgi:hypothetical protein
VGSQQMSTAVHRSPNKPMLCSVEQELCTFVQYSISKYTGYRVYSINKTWKGRKLFITIASAAS